MKRSHILVLSARPADASSANNDSRRLYRLCNYLSEWYRVTLISSSDVQGGPWHIGHGPYFSEHRAGKEEASPGACRTVSGFAGRADSSGLAGALSGTGPGDMHRFYLAAHASADVIVHDSCFAVWSDLLLGIDDIPRIYMSSSENYSANEKSEYKTKLIDFVQSLELYLINHVDLVVHGGEETLSRLERLVGRKLPNSMFIPDGLEAEDIRPARRDRAIAGRGRALFVGGSGYADREAGEFIVSILAPRAPHIEFHIAGACRPRGIPAPNVISHGVLDAAGKEALFAEADVVLNPVTGGSGTGPKGIEYLARGMPIVSTAFGMTGTLAEPGTHFLEADRHSMLSAIDRVLRDGGLSRRLGEAAARHAMSRLTWPAIAGEFHARIRKLTHSARSPARRVRHDCAVSSASGRRGGMILALNDYDPTISVGGGGTRILGLEKSLVADGYEVLILCLWDGDTVSRVSQGPGLTVIRVPKTEAHRKEAIEYDSRFHVSAGDIVSYLHAGRNSVLTGLYQRLREFADCIVLEHPYMAAIVRKHSDRFVYSSQNDELNLKSRMLDGHPLKDRLLEAVREAEDYCLGNASLIVGVSEPDLRAFSARMGCKGAPLVLVPNGSEAPTPFTPEQAAAVASIGSPSVVFVGSAHFPNVQAAWRIRDEYAPALPHVEFHIVGSCGEAVDGVKPSNMRIWGVVPSSLKSAIMSRVTLAINPVDSGGGSNVKLSDYLAHGLLTVTTPFGLRGYPPGTDRFVVMAPADDFANAIAGAVRDPRPPAEEGKAFFERHMSLASIGRTYARHIRHLSEPRPRVLFVTHRYVDPPLDGDEDFALRLLRELAGAGEFEIDVVCPDIGHRIDTDRFGSSYSPAAGAAPVWLPGVTWRRFPIDPPRDDTDGQELAGAWRVQGAFEAAADGVFDGLSVSTGHRLLSGWYAREADEAGLARWSSSSSTIRLRVAGRLHCAGHAPRSKTIRISSRDGCLGTREIGEAFDFAVDLPAGDITFGLEADQSMNGDPRPLGARFSALRFDGEDLIASDTLWEELAKAPFDVGADILAEASRSTRFAEGIRLSDLRGPFSAAMTDWLREHVRSYDLVLTHRSISKPALEAVSLAKAAGVPSVFVPHLRLDDDDYHFPDIDEALRAASLNLVSSSASTAALGRRGIRATQFGMGVTAEEFGDARADLAAFRAVYEDTVPFVLVLARGRGAARCDVAIDTAAILRDRGRDIRIVVIGPDDAGLKTPGLVHLGLQPREVVRGALGSALALMEMSRGGDFGTVVLEAWLAGTPVVACGQSAALRDLISDGVSGYLVSDATAAAVVIDGLLDDPALGEHLARAGRKVCERYGWRPLANELAAHLRRIISLSGRESGTPAARSRAARDTRNERDRARSQEASMRDASTLANDDALAEALARASIAERRVAELAAEVVVLEGRLSAAAKQAVADASGAAAKIVPPGMVPSAAGRPGRLRRWIRNLRRLQRRRLLLRSGLFDESWYLARYPDVAASGVDPIRHFLDFGSHEGRAPGPAFDPRSYLRTSPEAAEGGAEPWLHFARSRRR